MISVFRNENEIVVRCSNELINIEKIKGIVKTIKKIDKNNESPCKVIVKSMNKIQFSWHGERFFERISKSRILANSRITVGYED
jgi:hypothetical protein